MDELVTKGDSLNTSNIFPKIKSEPYFINPDSKKSDHSSIIDLTINDDSFLSHKPSKKRQKLNNDIETKPIESITINNSPYMPKNNKTPKYNHEPSLEQQNDLMKDKMDVRMENDEEEVEDDEDTTDDENFFQPTHRKYLKSIRERTVNSNNTQTVFLEWKDRATFEESLSKNTEEEWHKLSDLLISSDPTKTESEELTRISVSSSTDDKELLHIMLNFYGLFVYGSSDIKCQIERMQYMFPTVQSMHTRYKVLRKLFGDIYYELIDRNMIPVDEEDIEPEKLEIKTIMTEISFHFKMLFDQLVLFRLRQHMNDQSLRSALHEMSPMTFFCEMDTGKMKKHQQLLYFYLKQCFKNKYRRYGKSLYRPIFNQKGQFTYAYERVCDISDFIFDAIFPIELNPYWFECLTDSNNTATFCVKQLENIKTEWLPDLKRDRRIHSFRNGLFVTSTNEFYSFEKLDDCGWVGDLESSEGEITAMRYHDMDFRYREIAEEMKGPDGQSYHYTYVKMDSISNILSYQGFSTEERNFIYFTLGRMLYPNNCLDNFQFMPFFIGLAGTGKSLLLRLLCELFDPNDIAAISNSCQKTFQLDGLYKKMIMICTDMDENFAFDMPTLLNMISGETVSVIRKNKDPDVINNWSIPMAFASNRLPAKFNDSAGQLSRRWPMIEFGKRVLKVDTSLFHECLKELDKFLFVINSAYLDFRKNHGRQDIREFMPKKILKSSEKYIKQLNPIESFVEECCDLEDLEVERKTYILLWKDFTTHFRNYCIRNNFPKQTLTYTNCSGLFAKYQLQERTPKNGENDEYNQVSKYIVGIKLKNDVLME
jgi:hypothetical protein